MDPREGSDAPGDVRPPSTADETLRLMREMQERYMEAMAAFTQRLNALERQRDASQTTVPAPGAIAAAGQTSVSGVGGAHAVAIPEPVQVPVDPGVAALHRSTIEGTLETGAVVQPEDPGRLTG